MSLDWKKCVEKDWLCRHVIKMSRVSFLCKLVPPLPKILFFTISQPILQITEQKRCLDPCLEGQSSQLNYTQSVYMCPWLTNMQISATITEKSIFHYTSANIADNWTNKVSRPMFWGSKILITIFLIWKYVSSAC